MAYEIACFPSPGLVSPVSNGAHRDMDYYTFLDSTASLIKPIILCAETGLSNNSETEIFNNIRAIGIDGEKEMLIKTDGINTHKGMLFLMGVSSAAVANVIYKKKNFNEIRDTIKAMTTGLICRELYELNKKSVEKLTHGEQIFLKYNIIGIRGEIEKGLPIVFEHSLNFYDTCSDLNKNDRLINTLLYIMQYCDDTTILYRHDIETLNKVKKDANRILKIGGMRTSKGRKEVEKLNNEYIELGISPGGSADMLSVTIFLYMIKNEFYTY